MASIEPVASQDDAVESARAAGLRWVDDSRPGIRREGTAPRFRYVHADGSRVADEATLQRIRHIVIPPAWTDVWICPTATGHIQATGRDARRRKQYRYHPRWREVRDERKYTRMLDFGAALPRIRSRVAEDLQRPGLDREHVLAALVRLLDLTNIRVGNEEYAKENGSFGLTTLRRKHVDVRGARMRFHFRGKSGVQHEVELEDRRVARVIARIQDLAGEELFEWRDDAGELHPVTSDEVNAYLQEASRGAFTSKDFRTWVGTVLAYAALREIGPSETLTEAKRQLVGAIKQVSARLGNTPAVCRRCYVHPDVLSTYMDGRLLEVRTTRRRRDAGTGLSPDERAVLRLLAATGPRRGKRQGGGRGLPAGAAA